VQPERLYRLLQAAVGIRAAVALREPQRDLIGDVQPAERIAGIGVGAGDALDRRHDPAVDEAEGHRDRRGVGHVVQAIWSATESASVSIASPGLDTVSGPEVGAPRCWTT